MSDWNLWLDRKLALDLTVEEHRLADTLARLLLGFRRLEYRLGDDLIRQTSRMHGRSIARARQGLVEKGLYDYEPGLPGRGHRSLYRILLDSEKPAQEREIPREKPAKKPAQERARTKEGKYKSALGPEDLELQAVAVDAACAREAADDPSDEAEFDRIWGESAEPQRRGAYWEPHS